jgi:hypothetical protein
MQLLQDAIQSLTELCVEVREEGVHLRRQARRDSRNVSLMLGSIHSQENMTQNMSAVLNATSVQLRAQEGRVTWIGTASKEDRRDIVDLQQTLVALQTQVHQLEIRASACTCDEQVQEVVMNCTSVCSGPFRPRSEAQRVAAIAQSVEAALNVWMQEQHAEEDQEEEELEAQAEAAQEEDQVQDQEEHQ